MKGGRGGVVHDMGVEKFLVADFVIIEDWIRRERKVGVSGRGVCRWVGWPILDPCWSDSFKSLPTVTEKREQGRERLCRYFQNKMLFS